jgi:site-specific recombinase XerD
VLHGKGNKARTVGLDPAGFAMLDPWLEIRRGLDLPSQATVICTLTGKPVRSGYFRGALSKLARKAGIEKRVHPHGLRHTLAAELRAEGVDIGVISKQLGHTSIATTARYLDHIAPTIVIETMRERRWDAGSKQG